MTMVEATDGVALYAERIEPESGPSGRPAVIFSCAYTTTCENWRLQVAPLRAAGHSVVLWDYRGHGRSGAPDDPGRYTMEQVVDDLRAVLDWAAPAEPVVLAGLSFGGLASLHFALHHPARACALVLAASGPGFKNPEAAAEWRRRSERTASFIEEKGFESFVTGKAAPTTIGRRPELPAAKAAGEAIRAQSPAGVAEFGRRVAGLAPSVIDDLARIDQPALVVVGEEDAGYLRAAEVLSAKLPDSRYEVIPGAGHILNIEAAEAFDRLLLDFLAGLPASD